MTTKRPAPDTLNFAPRDLLSAWPARCRGPVFLTTYTFDPAFFEHVLLPVLQDRDASTVAVFVDWAGGVERNLPMMEALQELGRSWAMIPVRQQGCFHPKVHFFPAAQRALVGSGNLTRSGCGRNLEVFDVLTERDGSALGEVWTFFEKLLDHDDMVCLPSKDRERWKERLRVHRRPPSGGDAVLLHTLNGRPYR